MQFGLVISVLLHIAILGWAIFTIHSQPELRVSEPEPVAVDLVSPSEMTKLRQGVRTAKQMDAEVKEAPKVDPPRKEAAKPTPVTPKPEPPKEEVKPDPPKEVAKAEPPKEVKPDPPKEIKPEPPKADPVKDPIAEKIEEVKPDPAIEQARIEEEQRKAEEQKKIEAEKKAAELKKKQDDAKKRKEAELKKKRDEEKKLKEAEAKKNQKSFEEQVKQALLDKRQDKGAPMTNTESDVPSKNKGPVLGAREGRDKQLSANEFAAFVQQFKRCWSPPTGVAGAESLIPVVAFDLDRGGNVVAGSAKVVNNNSSPFFDIASRAAVNAVLRCAPYQLPAEKFSDWQHNEIEFDPSKMLGKN